MSYLNTVLVFCLLSIFNSGIAQPDSIEVRLQVIFGANALKMDTFNAHSYRGEPIRFEKLRFYIGDMNSLATDFGNYHLVDWSDEATHSFRVSAHKGVRLILGVDSLANVSGALAGDLDPTKGMYWTWQSGYINFKLEGTSPLVKTRKNTFQFHLGGYVDPYASAMKLPSPAESGKTKQVLVLDMEAFLSQLDLDEVNPVMSPGSKAMHLSSTLVNCFFWNEE